MKRTTRRLLVLAALAGLALNADVSLVGGDGETAVVPEEQVNPAEVAMRILLPRSVHDWMVGFRRG